jgi:hypothetical protein
VADQEELFSTAVFDICSQTGLKCPLRPDVDYTGRIDKAAYAKEVPWCFLYVRRVVLPICAAGDDQACGRDVLAIAHTRLDASMEPAVALCLSVLLGILSGPVGDRINPGRVLTADLALVMPAKLWTWILEDATPGEAFVVSTLGATLRDADIGETKH